MKKIRRWLYRRKIRRMYLRYCMMRNAYDCGDALFDQMSPGGALLWKQVEEGVAVLKAGQANDD